MKQFVFTLFLLNSLSLFGQIGPCSIDGGSVETDLHFMIDKIPDFYNLGEAGPDNLWLFGDLKSPRSFTFKYSQASEARYFSFFSDAEMVIREPLGKEKFFAKRDGKWYELGYVTIKKHSIKPQVIRYKVPINACTPDQFNNFSTYQASAITDDGELLIKFNDIKDASGILYLPNNNYDAYRTERKITSIHNGVDEVTTSYIFTDQLTNEFLMEVHIDENELPINILYKTEEPSIPTNTFSNSRQFLLYPNIGYGQVRLEFSNFETGNYTFTVYDIIQKKVWSKRLYVNSDITIKEDLSFLSRGNYTYTILDENQNIVLTRRFAIIKS